ncbi:hypothetical protein A3Q34_16300 [Colwellia sp. PAMC 20917]|nr:hypothetical protein A3Q34_16300 [Colwellia sp. PAMC 20917]
MKLYLRALFIFGLLSFNLSGCGGDTSEDNTEVVLLPADSVLLSTDISFSTVQASSLSKVSFNYRTSKVTGASQSATAIIDLPDQSKNIMGNILLALDVIDIAGIEQISLDFSNGNPDIAVLQICGASTASCLNDEFNEVEGDNTSYRLFINGLNPHDYNWQSGPNIINVWVDNVDGDRSIAATLSINWQAVVIESTQAEFINVIHDDSTGANTGDLSINWSVLPDYLFYNVFIATEPGISSDNVTSYEGGQARLSLVANNVVFEGIDADKEYYFTVSGVNDGGESAFSLQKSVIDLSRGAPVVKDDFAELNENDSIIINVIENDSDDLSSKLLIISQLSNGTNGQVFDNGDGSVTYVHDGSETTSDQFTYKVNDGEFDSATATVTLNITLLNDIPLAQNDSANVDEGGVIKIDVRNNDTDEESLINILTVSNISQANHGVVLNNNDGTITYSHDGSETLSDSFTYTINDGTVDSAPATVSITITAVNDTPVAANDVASVNENGNVIIALRSNDSDAETPNGALTVTNLSVTSNGTIVNNNDGTVTYSHDGSETLSDSFTYTINDGTVDSAPATVSITITAVNDTPVAANDVASVNENGNVIIALRSNDSDAETPNGALTVTNLSVTSNGTIVNNNDGTVTYSHDGSETLSDSFTYTINDGTVDSAPATVSITITAVNDTPVAANDVASVNENGNVIIALRSNDSDAETPNGALTVTNLSVTSNGTIVNNNDGTVTYSHDGSETLSDSFTYTINDGTVDSAPATVSITITAVNDTPVAANDVASVNENGNVIIALRSNDSDAETPNGALTVTNLSVTSNGTIVNNNDGTVTYSHDGSETLSDSFTYTINDGTVDSAPATVSITITAVNDTPVAANDVASVNENGNVIIALRSNDSDAETPNGALTVTNLSVTSNGTIVNNNDGTVTYSHDGSETLSDSFTYTINDGTVDSAPATVSITITAVNDTPVAANDVASVNENGNVIIALRSNDSDAETPNGALTVTNLSVTSNGTIVNNNDGTVTYSHDGSETLSDSFTYTINDGTVDSAPATVSITITAVNDTPVAANDVASVNENGNVIIALRSNDSDAETPNGALTVTNLSVTSNGTIVNNNDGTVTYSHDGSETLSDSFTYTINDGTVDSAPATVSITITAVNDTPVAANDVASVNENGNVIIALRSNDSDAETPNGALTVTNLSVTSNGTIVNNNDGTVTYSHDGSETLSDSFTYTINDGTVDSAPATVSITITAVNDTPVAANDVASVNENGNVIIALRSNDSDAETPNGALTVTNLSVTSNGTIVNNNDGTVTYSHDGSETLSDSFTYTINDGTVDSAPATVSITITAVNDTPAITSSSTLNLAENTANNTLVYTATATDAELGTISWSLVDENNVFIINGSSGAITINDNSALDYETFISYDLQLIATDDGVPRQADNILVTVSLSDVNEKPTLTATPSSQVIAENAQVNDAITTVVATDPENSAQTWTISAGNADGIFGIDGSGNVTIIDITNLNYEVTNQYTLTVKAEDSGTPTIFETLDITVDVSDIIENQELALDAFFGNNGGSSFNTYSYASDDSIVSTVRQTNGKLVLVVNVDIQGDKNIASIRMNTDGSVDTTYGDKGRKTFIFANSQIASKAVLDSSDNLYIVGTETISGFNPFVIKVDNTGNLDTSFNTDGKFDYSFLDSSYGQDILIHSNGYIYIACDGYSSTFFRNSLKMIRIDTSGALVNLNSDLGAGEYNLFNPHDFFAVGLAELSSGELVVIGDDYDVEISEGNFSAAVLNQTDFTQLSLIAATFDVKQVVTTIGSSDDKVETYLNLNNDSFIFAGASNYLQGISGPLEATLLKIDVTNASITVNSSFATSGVYTADVDGSNSFASSIISIDLDSSSNITFGSVADIGEGGPNYLIDQLTNVGAINGSFTSPSFSANYPVMQAMQLIVDPTNDHFYLANITGQVLSDDILFKQLLNDGTEVATSTQMLNFTGSYENLIDINLLSMVPNQSALWVNTYKPTDINGNGGSLSLLSSDGALDHTLNKGKSTLQTSGTSYGPSLELADGSLIFTRYDSSNNLTIYKVTDKEFTPDINFVPSFGYAQVNLTFSSQINDISYDAFTNHIIIVGTVNGSGNDAFIIKVNATDGTLFNGGSYVSGLAIINVAGSFSETLNKVIAQGDGTLIGLGSIDVAGFINPYLLKIDSGGELDLSFNGTGYKSYDLGLASQNITAVDIVQLVDSSFIFNVNNLTASTSHFVKTNSSGIVDPTFASSGILNLAIGATATVLNDITLDSNEVIYAVGHGTNADNDNLVVKILSVDGSLDPLFNAYITPGYSMFDEGGNETLKKILFDPFNEHIILGNTTLGPIGNVDIQLRAYNLIQNDN